MLPTDVDYRVMLTFLEFHEALLGFVNFKLFHTLGLHYPPLLDARLEAASAGLEAVMKVRAVSVPLCEGLHTAYPPQPAERAALLSLSSPPPETAVYAIAQRFVQRAPRSTYC